MISVAENINLNVYETLSQINTQNNFNYDLVVERLTCNENKTGHLKLIIADCNPERLIPAQTGGYLQVEKDYQFELYIYPSKDDNTPISTYFTLVKSDIQKAMYEDIKRGGWADNTTVDNDELILNDDGKVVGMSFNYVILYRYRENDPTSL